jgi:hypothetical protein
MIATSKWSLISESVAVIQIGVHPVGEEPDQHIVRMAPRVSHKLTIRKVPTKSKSDPYSRDEFLASSDRPAQSSSCAASFSLQQTTSKQGGVLRQSSC